MCIYKSSSIYRVNVRNSFMCNAITLAALYGNSIKMCMKHETSKNLLPPSNSREKVNVLSLHTYMFICCLLDRVVF